MAERVAVVLAAGASSRWGDTPKALADLGGVTALGRILRSIRRSGVELARVVLGARAPEIRAGRLPPELPTIEWVDAPGWRSGRTASIQAGLGGLPPEREVLLWPVDHPLVEPATVERLLEVADRDAIAVWILPEYQGRGGHPVLLKPAAWQAIFDLAPETPLRALIPRFGPQVLRLSVADRGVVVNLNMPSDLERARSGAGPPEEEKWTAD